MKKDAMISIRISDEEKDWINVIKRYDSEFNVSNFFRVHLAVKKKEIEERVGATGIGFFQVAAGSKKTGDGPLVQENKAPDFSLEEPLKQTEENSV